MKTLYLGEGFGDQIFIGHQLFGNGEFNAWAILQITVNTILNLLSSLLACTVTTTRICSQLIFGRFYMSSLNCFLLAKTTQHSEASIWLAEEQKVSINRLTLKKLQQIDAGLRTRMSWICLVLQGECGMQELDLPCIGAGGKLHCICKNTVEIKENCTVLNIDHRKARWSALWLLFVALIEGEGGGWKRRSWNLHWQNQGNHDTKQTSYCKSRLG